MSTTNTKECALGLSKCQPRSLTEAVHCVARHSGIDTHRLAESETDYATFIRWTEPNGLCQMPARKLAALAQHTRRLDHIQWINSDAGLIAARRMQAVGLDRTHELLDAAEAFGALCAANRDAGSVVDSSERDRLIGRLRQVQRELAEYEQTLTVGK